MLSRGSVRLRVPREEDFALLVALRNRERHWFGDPRELDPDEAAAWFATRHDDDRLMCIETDGMVVGTLGWTRVQAPGRVYEVGRMIADYRAAKAGGVDRAQLHRAMRLAIVMTADYLAWERTADMVYFRIRPQNGFPRGLLKMLGLHRKEWPYPSSGPELECWGGNVADWVANRDRVLALVDGLQVGEPQDKTGPNQA